MDRSKIAVLGLRFDAIVDRSYDERQDHTCVPGTLHIALGIPSTRPSA